MKITLYVYLNWLFQVEKQIMNILEIGKNISQVQVVLFCYYLWNLVCGQLKSSLGTTGSGSKRPYVKETGRREKSEF